MWLLVLAACRPVPWGAADVAVGDTSGAFLAEVGSVWPGVGWFDAGDVEGQDVVRAQVLDVAGARTPVVQIQVLGRSADGWHSLELDVALDRWAAGTIPLDGQAAVGLLTSASGESWYLLAGDLEVTQAGASEGQLVEGRFTEIPMWRER
jgi:hypothetical protein